MPDGEAFTIPLGRSAINGTLRAADSTKVKSPGPSVLVIDDFPGAAAPIPAIADELAHALPSVGITAATFTFHPLGSVKSSNDARSFRPLDEAAAVFHWLSMRDDLDQRAIGVCGIGLGVVIAACLAGRTDQIRRLCLIGSCTVPDITNRIAKPNGLPPLVSADALSEGELDALSHLTPKLAAAEYPRPTLILHSAADRVVSPASARAFAAELERVGCPFERELIARADHALTDPDQRAACVARILRFFQPLNDAQPSSSDKRDGTSVSSSL